MDELANLTDQATLTDRLHAIFETTDTKDWDACLALFADQVDVDFTGLAGGEPARVAASQLVDAWRTGLHPRKTSFHQIGNQRIAIAGDTATVTANGYAWNMLDAGLGGGVWEVWGRYDLAFRRTTNGWKCTAFAFTARRTQGDDAVRTHGLDGESR